MQPENKGLRFLFLILDISLLFVAIYLIAYFNPIIEANINLFLLHAAVAEIIAYTLYSKRNYYFLDNFKNDEYSAYQKFVSYFGLLGNNSLTKEKLNFLLSLIKKLKEKSLIFNC